MKTGSITAIGAACLLSLGAPVRADDVPDAPSLPSKAEEPEPDRDQLLEQQMLELKERLARSEDAQRNAKSPLSIHGSSQPSGQVMSANANTAGGASFTSM